MPRDRRGTGVVRRSGRVFVDSGAWIAFFSARDRHHREADRMLRAAVSRRVPLFTTNLIIAETHRFLLFHVSPQAAARVIDRVETHPGVTLAFATVAHHKAAREWLARLADQRISYTDAVSFAVMEAVGCSTALSFDHHFSLAGFRLWQHDA